MFRISIRLFLLPLGLLLWSCSRHTTLPPAISQADSLSATCPQAAVSMIDSLGSTLPLSAPATWAYYQLIRTKVYDRAYIRHTSDSLILRVIDYYEHHPEGDLLAWAYCYGGRVYRDLNDAPRALSYFYRSLEALPATGSQELRARVLSQIGYIYYSQSLFREARDVKRQVLRLDSLAGRQDRMAVGYKDLAQCSYSLREPDSARLFIHQAQRLCEELQLQRPLPDVMLLRARIAREQGQAAEALSLITPYLADSTLLQPVPYCLVGAQACMDLGRHDEASLLCQRILQNRDASIHAVCQAARLMSAISRSRGNLDSVHHYQDLCAMALDSISLLDQSLAVQQVSQLYDYQLREQENRLLHLQLRQWRMGLWMVLLLAGCLLLAVWALWLRYRHRRTQSRLQHLRIEHLQAELSLRDKSIQELSSLIAERQQCAADFESNLRNSTLMSRLRAHLNNQTILSADEWAEVEQYFSEHLPQFLPHLHQVHDFSTVEWHLSLLIRLGLRNVEIASLLCKHPSAITYAKKRLSTKVLGAEAKAEVWDEFVRRC